MEILVRKAAPEEVRGLRHKVLRVGMPPESAIFPGDDEAGAVHLVAVAREAAGDAVREAPGDEVICGVATFLIRPFPADPAARAAWQLRGMAVDPRDQGKGIGSRLLDFAIGVLPGVRPGTARELSAAEGRRLWCKAREGAVKFYENNGWRVAGEAFDVPPFGPHRLMEWVPPV